MTEKNTTRSTRPCGARRLKSGKDRRETESKNDVLEKELEGEISYPLLDAFKSKLYRIQRVTTVGLAKTFSTMICWGCPSR